jgi:2-oxoglutarate dehydrogenase E2 component (dihydrolipoamide succinyltransferase)
VENSVEVRYAGVVVGRGALLKELGPDAIFVGMPEPLPVGTLISLKIGDATREARVEDVVESAEPTAVGMRVRWGAAAPAARPAPAAAPEPAKAAAPAPTAAAPAPEPAKPAVPSPVVAAAPDKDPAAPEVAATDVGSSSLSAESGAIAGGDSGPNVAGEVGDDGSGAIPAPLSLAGGSGGGKRRRKRR